MHYELIISHYIPDINVTSKYNTIVLTFKNHQL